MLWFMALIKTNPIKREAITPMVSLVISAYNEEKVLAQKIENSLELDYPQHLLQIAVISDGSTDKTNDIIRNYANQDARILPCIVAINKGKDSCLNDFVPKLNGEIVLFSDANSFYDKDLIQKIVQPFADRMIGLVTGSTLYYLASGDQSINATSLYSQLEKITKSLESRIGSCVGADGAVFAMRKELFSGLKPYEINDLALPLQVVKNGYRTILDKHVFCKEEAPLEGVKNELNRNIRITKGAIISLFSYKILLNPLCYPFYSFAIFSHKFMKFLSPFFLCMVLIVNIPLAWYGPHIYKVTLILQVFLYILVFTIGKGKNKRLITRFANICRTFIMVNAAYFVGWIKFFKGETYSSWKPNR